MITPEIEKDFLKDNQILGLKFLDGAAVKTFFCKIKQREIIPRLVYEFGSVSATGESGWVTLKKGTYDILVPDDSGVVLHVFWGVYPTTAKIYFRIPTDTDRWSVVGTRVVGEDHGCITGMDSPFNEPSLITRYFAVKDVTPAFNAYNPTNEDQEIKIKFVGMKYRVTWLNCEEVSEDDLLMARIFTVGGIPPVPKPSWMEVSGCEKEPCPIC